MNKKYKVLIADDNKLNLQLFSDLLSIKGVDVVEVSEGDKVIETAMKEKPDLIITDIRLGQVSGIKLVRDIKNTKNISDIPIISITAYVTEQDKHALHSLGCTDYLSKPVSMNDFYAVIGKYIEL